MPGIEPLLQPRHRGVELFRNGETAAGPRAHSAPFLAPSRRTVAASRESNPSALAGLECLQALEQALAPFQILPAQFRLHFEVLPARLVSGHGAV